MLNHDLRVGNYARVSGDKQAKDGTIASQLEAITERVASDGLECEPELCFVDDGYSGDILVRPGLERLRDQYAARHGSVNVLSGAPYGYRYVSKHEGGGQARYQVVADEARVVRKIFEWVGQERCTIGEVCRRLQRDGVATRTGKSAWDRSVIWSWLKNPAYKGTAAFGKTRAGALKPQRLRPQRGRPEQPKRPVSRVDASVEDQIFIDV